LDGAPYTVEGAFSCDYNQLKSLDGAPGEVGRAFYCSFNPVEFTQDDKNKAMAARRALGESIVSK
jgi:hypothetical protein